jgi:hypothetical protein
MKTSITLGLTLAASLAAVLVPSSNVLAAPAIHSGNICHNYNKNQANDLDFYTDGAKNGVAAARSVICPLVVTHTPGQTTGSVWIDFNTSVPFTCTLYSYSDGDVYLGSKSATTGSGTSRFTFIGTVPANTFSNHSVLCTLPASYAGKIVAIESNF